MREVANEGRVLRIHRVRRGAWAGRHRWKVRIHRGVGLTAFFAPQSNTPRPQSDLAQQMLKDPYKFDFLSLGKEAQEREVEKALVHHIRDFLLELGKGFAFVGNQVHLEVGDEDFYVDLLFYHLRLRCFVVVELKSGKFLPEYAGKMSFYLSAVDHLMKHPDDKPSIGIILCRGKNQTIVEFALQDNSKPMGVAEYELTRALPDELQTSLPTIEQLELEAWVIVSANQLFREVTRKLGLGHGLGHGRVGISVCSYQIK